jgi:hypothetical protein
MSSLREWHGFENSVRWRLVPEGVEIEGSGVERTRGRPDMVTRVWNTFGDEINQVARARKVPCPLIIATICTESGGKPDATRHEPGYTSDEATPHRVSIGLTQTLISTAREVMKMKVDGAWLRQPYNAINAGAGYIEKQSRSTKLDPPLVAAAYNAGSLVRNDGPKNRWKLRQYPIGTSEHCDRFVKFYNDAVFMLSSHSRRPAVGHEVLLEGYAPVRSSAPAPAPREEPARAGGGGGGWGGFGQLGGFGGLAGLGGLFGGSGGSAAGPFGSTGAPGTPGSEAEVVFGENAHRDGVTPYSLKVLREILVSAGLKKCTISSTSRSPAEQAQQPGAVRRRSPDEALRARGPAGDPGVRRPQVGRRLAPADQERDGAEDRGPGPHHGVAARVGPAGAQRLRRGPQLHHGPRQLRARRPRRQAGQPVPDPAQGPGISPGDPAAVGTAVPSA